MLSLYLIALLVGGFLLAMSMLGGGSHDVDVDVDVDIDVDADVDADADGDADHGGIGVDALLLWLPFASLRFWTFFAAFFGLTGVAMTAGKLTGQYVGLGLAIGVGYVCGAGMTRVIKKLSTDNVTSAVGPEDLIGETARVILPVTKEEQGKIRLNLKGRTIELIAETDENTTFDVGQTCIVYGMKDDGAAVVARMNELTE